jgi:hypothetical protein
MLRKNVAGQRWVVFAFEDEGGTNPGEPVTGDAANITANLRLDGGAANAVDDTNPTELEDGFYVFDLTAAETNADNIVIAPASSTANVNVVGTPMATWTIDLPTNFADLSITATTGRVDVASIEGSDATNQIRDAVVDDATRIDASALNTAATAIGSNGSGLTEAGGTGDHLTAVPWNSSWDAEVQSEVTDALNAYDPPTRAELSSDIAGLNDLSAAQVNAEVDTAIADAALATASALATVNANVDAILVDTGTTIPDTLSDIQGATFNTATDSLEAIRDRGDSAWITGGGGSLTAADIADAVWTEAIADHSGTVGSTAEALDAAGGGVTAAAIADAVWDEAQSGHTTAGSFGEVATEIATILSTTNNLPDSGALSSLATAAALATVNANVDDILQDTGTTIPNTLSDIQGATFNSTTDSLEAIRNRGDEEWITATGFSTHTADDVWTVTTRVLTAGTNLNDITAADVWAHGTRVLTAGTNLNDLSEADIRTAIGLTAADLDTQLGTLATSVEISALNDISADDVWNRTISQPGTVPGAAAQADDILGALGAVMFNEVSSTATTMTVRNAADSGDLYTAAISDDGTTATKGGLS